MGDLAGACPATQLGFAQLTQVDNDHTAVEVFIGVFGAPTPVAFEWQL